MTTVVLVHGTGSRNPKTQAMYDHIEQKLHSQRADLKVLGCYWGDEVGAKLNASGASVPTYAITRAVGGVPEAVSEADREIALWDQLYRDPLYELRLLAVQNTGAADFIPGQVSAGQILNDKVANLQPGNDLQAKLSEAGVGDLFDRARQDVSGSDAYSDAVGAAAEPLAPYRSAVARAIVAQIVVLCEGSNRYERLSTDATLRGQVVDLLVDELGGRERSIFGDLVLKPLSGIATWYLRSHRRSITDAVDPTAGDVILYQGRGDPIRKAIYDVIAKAEPPVIVLAHSLGGIASVDLLAGARTGAMPALDNVKLLVTVGSQAPFFYEIKALNSMSYGDPLPGYFPSWLNIYDLRDFLSYIGGGLFPGRVQDVKVDNRQPFPQAHSAYWDDDLMWNAFFAKLKEMQL